MIIFAVKISKTEVFPKVKTNSANYSIYMCSQENLVHTAVVCKMRVQNCNED